MNRIVRAAACAAAAAAVSLPARPQAQTSVGPLPSEALALPADIGLLMGLDAKAFFASAEYRSLLAGQPLPGMPPPTQAEVRDSITRGLLELEQKTGVNPERDLDRVVIAFGSFDKEARIAVLALGRLDAARITSAFEGETGSGTTVERKTVAGRTVFVATKGGKPDGAQVFLSERALLAGHPDVVDATLRSSALGRRPLDTNLVNLAKRLDPAATFFIVVGPTMTAAMRKGAQPPPFPIPDTLSLASRFGGALELVGEMPDEAAARNMADLVRGGVAGLRIQLAQDKTMARGSADVNRLLDGIQISAEGRRARLFAPGPTGGIAGVGMLAAIAIPSLLRARVAANEASVIGDTRAVISAQAAYQSAAQGYGSLSCLSKPGACVPGYAGPAFLDEQLAGATEKTGYRRAFHPGPAGKRLGTYRGFAYTAAPLEPGKTGLRSFCGDATGRICFDPKGSPIVPSSGSCPQTCSDVK